MGSYTEVTYGCEAYSYTAVLPAGRVEHKRALVEADGLSVLRTRELDNGEVDALRAAALLPVVGTMTLVEGRTSELMRRGRGR